ncbi:MAG: hypothetical protein WC908_02455 [Candidatus Paceibacterota bacterium]
MSYIDEELKIDINEDEEGVENKNLEEDLNEPIDDDLVDDDLLVGEFAGLDGSEY